MAQICTSQPFRDGEFEESVWDRIAFHGIAPILQSEPDRIRDWPENLLNRIAEQARLSTLWEATHRECVSDAITALESRGISSVAMKGTALAYSLYDNPAHRRRGDTDLLIRPADRVSARKAFAELGWQQRRSPHGLFFQETWLFDTGAGFIHELDLHWQPHDRPTIQNALRIDDFFEKCLPMTRLCAAARMPSLPLTLTQTAVNQAWHEARGLAVDGRKVLGGKRLIWAKDCDLIVRECKADEWQELIRICRERGTNQIVKKALKFAKNTLDTAVPREVLEELAMPPKARGIAHYLQNPNPIEEFRQDMRNSKGLKAKLRWVAANASPERPHLERKYPRLQNWPTIALQVRYVAGLAIRLVQTRIAR